MARPEILAEYGLFVRRSFLDLELCAALRSEAHSAAWQQAGVLRSGVSTVDEKVRRTRRIELAPQSLAPVEERLRLVMPELGEHFAVALHTFERPQLLVYRRGDFFSPHVDNHHDPAQAETIGNRKVSAVIFLNGESRAPSEGAYCGGALVFYRLVKELTVQNARVPLNGEPAVLVAFRSSVHHEVTRVLHGERYTMVTWFA